MAGLSRCGFQTFQIGFNNLEIFSYIKDFSGPGMFSPETEPKTVCNGVFSGRVAYNKKVHAFFLCIGALEGQIMKSLSNALKLAGIHNTYYESIGTAYEWLI